MKRLIFGDIHFGKKGNSHTFNNDCHDFLDMMIEYTKDKDIDEVVFLGDWFHSRNSINVSTMKSGIDGIRKLAKSFKKIYFIIGNHDLYYRDSRAIHSLEIVKEFDNIILVDDIIEDKENDATYVPWLTDSDYKKVFGINTKYIFGHFELPTFLLNNVVRMPDTGKINVDSFSSNVEYIFSGHFHKRQKKISKKNKYEVHYIGNCFPHDFSDTNDTQRGFCILESGEEPQYINWRDMPNYLSVPLSYILKSPFHSLNAKTYAKIEVDLQLGTDDVMFIREELMKMHNSRELSFTYKNEENEEFEDIDETTFESIDDIVLKSLDNVDSPNFDKDKLKNLYLNI